MIKQVSAGFVIFRWTREGPKFLLLYDRGHDWNFPRGKLGTEEKSFHGALRETQEETGLKRADLRIKRGFKAYERFTFLNRDRNKVFKTIIFYLAETSKKQIELSHEHEGFGWFSYQDAKELLTQYKERGAVLKKANSFIRQARRPRRRHSIPKKLGILRN
jgi:bis(5'-nucleosidyl)-tetraphosphatase